MHYTVGLVGIGFKCSLSVVWQSLLLFLCAKTQDLNLKTCQISSPLHIFLCWLDQVALNFTSLQPAWSWAPGVPFADQHYSLAGKSGNWILWGIRLCVLWL